MSAQTPLRYLILIFPETRISKHVTKNYHRDDFKLTVFTSNSEEIHKGLAHSQRTFN